MQYCTVQYCTVQYCIVPPYYVRADPASVKTAYVTNYHRRGINRNNYKHPKSVQATNNQLPTATPAQKNIQQKKRSKQKQTEKKTSMQRTSTQKPYY